jgi:hypothetical protein
MSPFLYRKLPKVNLSRSLGRELNTKCPLYQPYADAQCACACACVCVCVCVFEACPCRLIQVDPEMQVGLCTWPLRALSLNQVAQDVHMDRQCISNIVMTALHRVQHEMSAVGSTMFDQVLFSLSFRFRRVVLQL